MENKKVVIFGVNKKLQGERVIQSEDIIGLQRGELTLFAVNEVSDYLKGLSLGQEQNDTMIQLMANMLLAAEHEKFLQGFDMGIKSTQIGEGD